MSGWASGRARRHCRPSPASPTTVAVSLAGTRRRSGHSCRTSGWSSTIRTRIGCPCATAICPDSYPSAQGLSRGGRARPRPAAVNRYGAWRASSLGLDFAVWRSGSAPLCLAPRSGAAAEPLRARRLADPGRPAPGSSSGHRADARRGISVDRKPGRARPFRRRPLRSSTAATRRAFGTRASSPSAPAATAAASGSERRREGMPVSEGGIIRPFEPASRDRRPLAEVRALAARERRRQPVGRHERERHRRSRVRRTAGREPGARLARAHRHRRP